MFILLLRTTVSNRVLLSLLYTVMCLQLHAVDDISSLVKKVKKSVVNISVETAAQSGHLADSETQPLGSGVILDADDGIIITCAHVVNNSTHLLVTLNDKRRFIGRIIGLDEISDIALIKIEGDHLTSIPIAKEDEGQLGDSVIAIGSPYGLNDSITFGIISSRNRDLNLTKFDNYLQTDAQINFGNSGGALINSDGNLVGINASVLTTYDQHGNANSSTGIGFAIPVEVFKPITKQLLENGQVERGIMGAYVQPLNPQLANALATDIDTGILVSDIIPGGPSETAGIENGDIITHINGTRVESTNHLISLIGTTRVGESVQLRVTRNDSNLDKTVTIVKQIEAHDVKKTALDGLVYSDYSIIDGNGNTTNGAIILDVSHGSPGWVSGLKVHDIILEVDRQIVNDSRALSKLSHTARPLLMRVQRDTTKFYLSIN
ncbi:MAG: protease [Legionellales bacterium]|nr:protease [Legionellales bacterium]|tara:strand:- start:225 stop:1529 length:1305 start_codon:yes stop_codon:yes gene_type:complete